MLSLFFVSALVVAASADFNQQQRNFQQQPLTNQFRQPQQYQQQQQLYRQQPQQHQQQFQQPQPLQRQTFIPIVSQVDRRDDAGQFSLQYQSGDGTVFTEQGVLKRTPDGLDNVLVKTGSYSYTSPEGVPVAIQYTADENGFQPTGDAIPVQTVNVDQQQRQ